MARSNGSTGPDGGVFAAGGYRTNGRGRSGWFFAALVWLAALGLGCRAYADFGPAQGASSGGSISGTSGQWTVDASGDLVPVGDATDGLGDATHRVADIDLGNGSAESPSLSFRTGGVGTGLGFYSSAADRVSFAVGGAEAFIFDNYSLRGDSDGARQLGQADNRFVAIYANHHQAGTQSVSGTASLGATSAEIVLVSSSGAYTITLPTVASAGAGRRYVFLADSSVTGVNKVTVDGSGAETLSGATTFVMALPYFKLSIICDGTGWLVEHASAPYGAVTLTSTWTTNTTITAKAAQSGKTLHVSALVTNSGAPDSATLEFSGITGFTVDTVALPTTTTLTVVGQGFLRDDSTSAIRHCFVSWPGSGSALRIYQLGATGTTPVVVTQASPWTWAANDTVCVTFTVPVQ